MNNQTHVCPICDKQATLLDVVDFNKSCEEQRGKFLSLSGQPIYYAICSACTFSWSPEMYNWSIDTFASKVYNEGYAEIDPDYLEHRPTANAGGLLKMFPQWPAGNRHLDYGGGNGLLSRLLTAQGWNSTSYDPFVDVIPNVESLGKFQLITAFVVFEHVPNVKQLMTDLKALLSADGIILFTTLLSDGKIQQGQRLSWWYASPRNGHISLFSHQSLTLLANQYAWSLASFNSGFHAMCNTVPSWASHLIKTNLAK